jgi:hypothetical protein
LRVVIIDGYRRGLIMRPGTTLDFPSCLVGRSAGVAGWGAVERVTVERVTGN